MGPALGIKATRWGITRINYFRCWGRSYDFEFWLRFNIENYDLLVILRHCENGSPENPLLQTHIGIWFLTRQYAFTPQRPGHGSWHLRLIQALSGEQSEFMVHSGRQFGGEPIIWDWQLHSQRSPTTRGKFAFGPQGFGSHGSISSTIGSTA